MDPFCFYFQKDWEILKGKKKKKKDPGDDTENEIKIVPFSVGIWLLQNLVICLCVCVWKVFAFLKL